MCVPCHTGDESVAPKAQQRMLEVCRQVITRAAQDTWQQTDGHSQYAGAAHHVTDGTSWEQVTLHAIWEVYITLSLLFAASCSELSNDLGEQSDFCGISNQHFVCCAEVCHVMQSSFTCKWHLQCPSC